MSKNNKKNKLKEENMNNNVSSENIEENTDKAEGTEEELNAAAAAEMAEEIAEEAQKNDELAQLKDRYIRQAAEFDNYRKRTEKEKAAMFDMGAMHVLNKLLSTVDNFERGLKNAPDDAFGEGMKMIYKELGKMLEDLEVKPIEAVGQEFNPDLHNAVMHEEDDSGEENIVTEELQKGYKFKDHILRYSMVKVKN